MKTFVVIGLGRFGSAVATELCSLGHEVLAIDADSERVQKMAEQVTHAAAGDAKDPAVLRALGVRNFDCAIVAAGSDVGDSALITLNLKEAGVKQVVCKAQSHVHRKVLEKIGADQVVFPEKEMALHLAQSLSNEEILNYIELSGEYSILERMVPDSWQGKSLSELNIRAKHHLTVIAIRRGKELIISPGADARFRAGDSMLVLGGNHDIEKVENL